MSRSVQPKRECSHATSLVCTTAEPGTRSRIRAASVVLPLLLRPSTARIAGRPGPSRPGPRRVMAFTTVLSNSARHGPASGSSSGSSKAMNYYCARLPW